MAAAARMHGIEQGIDLSGVALIAFGGAGPVHACAVAELLESTRVIFPVNASVLSAFGTLVSPVRIDLARSMVRLLGAVERDERDRLLDELRAEGRRVLVAAGAPMPAVTFRYGVDARYAGQGNEITLWVGEGEQFAVSDDEIASAFDTEYRNIYGMTIPDVAIEIVTWRISAFASATVVDLPLDRQDPTGTREAPHHQRMVKFRRGEPAIEVPVYRREQLGTGATFDGPAIVEERETTAVVRPGWSVEVARDGSMVATREVRS
jgi:N-methylhydantoinase A